MKDYPKVSIVTPSYNQAQFLERTILSVKNQDYLSIEHTIVDGGSTDNTLEIPKNYEDTYNMRWVSEPDEGQVNAINKRSNKAIGLKCSNFKKEILPGFAFRMKLCVSFGYLNFGA